MDLGYLSAMAVSDAILIQFIRIWICVTDESIWYSNTGNTVEGK